MKPEKISFQDVDEKIIYIRFKGSYASFRKESKKMANQLFTFAKEHNLIIEDVTKVLTIYDDNPYITDVENLRTSVAMSVPKDIVFEEEDDICISKIKGKFCIGHFELGLKDYNDAWNYMYEEWAFKHKDSLRDAPPFELYVNEPPRNFKCKSQVDIYIAISNS